MKNMSLEESNEAMNKVLENAQELVEEATLLLNNKSFARAYSLAHLACEETEKVIMVFIATFYSSLGKTVDWKKFYRKIRDHKEKIGGTLINDSYFVQCNDINLDHYINFFDNYQKGANKRINELNDLKNDSIYTGFKNNEFYKPSEVINEEMAIEQINKANRLIKYHKRMINNVQANLNAIQNDPFTKYKYQVFLEHLTKKWKIE